MIYYDWHTAMSSLLFGENATALDKSDHHNLFFSPNFFLPKQTRIITIDRSIPKNFVQTIDSSPSSIADGFFLPGGATIVEDDISAIGFVDLRSGQTGISAPRIFLHIEKATETLDAGSLILAAIAQEISGEKFEQEDFFGYTWGYLDAVEGLNTKDNKRTGMSLTPWGLAVTSARSVELLEVSKTFEHYQARERLPAGFVDDSSLFQLLEELGATLVGNLAHGLLQIAYHNVLVGEAEG